MPNRERRVIVKNSLPGFGPLAAVLMLLALSQPLQAANPPDAAAAPAVVAAPASVQLAWDRVGSPVRSYQV